MDWVNKDLCGFACELHEVGAGQVYMPLLTKRRSLGQQRKLQNSTHCCAIARIQGRLNLT